MRFSSALSPLVLLSSALLLSSPSMALAPAVAADACIALGVDLNVQIPSALLGLVHTFLSEADLNIQICLCLDLTVSTAAQNAQINAFIASTPVLQTLSNIITLPATRLIISGLFNSSPQCPYVPTFGHRICTAQRTCGIQCDPGFSYNAATRTCDCSAPKNLCGSTCQVQACGSPVTRRRSPILRGRERCEKKGHTFCPVQGARDSRVEGVKGVSLEWECLDTETGLESCGGCPFASSLVAPVLFSASAQASNDLEIGTDCSAVPNIDSVSCLQGKCVVHACASGWKVSRGGDACERR